MSVEEFSKRLEMFKNGFDAISSNLENQLAQVDAKVDKLVENTTIIPKIRKDNKEMFKQLQKVSGIIGELMNRLNQLEYQNL